MFGNSKEPSQDPFCHSFSKNTMIGDSKNSRTNLIEGAYNAILEELIDNAVLELCFEVHREVKLTFPIPTTFTIPYQLIQTNGKNRKQTESITCYTCGAIKGPINFTKLHLSDCMGDPTNADANLRKARSKLYNFKEWESDEEDDTDPMKKERNKKRVKGKSRSLGNPLSKAPQNSGRSYLDMSNDEIKAFFNQKCGVVTKRSKKLCSNSHKCSIHSEIERSSVRRDLLRDESDNGQIDVDTVEKSDIQMSFSTANMPDYPSGSFEYF